MANRNTKFARNRGYSDMARLLSKGKKNYGQKTGQCLDTGKLRKKSGKAPWRGGVKAEA